MLSSSRRDWGGDNIIEQTFKGPIQQQLRDALQYIRNTIITEKVVKYPDRAEADRFFNYPFAAIEEALSNAVYHRAYDEREPIEVRVETDRMEILSFPGPDRSVTMEGLKSYRVSNRRYRNRRIGDFLKELHLTEGRNTGLKKILDALEANGSPKPEFETDEARSYFITRLFIHEGFGDAKHENEHVSTPNSTPSTPNSTPLPKDLQGLPLREQILVLIKKNPSISKKKMTQILGVSMYALKKELAVMSGEHVAEFVGYSRSGKWVVY